MKKRTFKLLLVAMAVTIVALMGAGQIMAQGCDPPWNCTIGGWQIELESITTDSSQGYKWVYKFTKLSGAQDISHVDFSFPVCCPDELTISVDSQSPASYTLDSSDPSSYFGNHITEIFVRKFNTGTQKSTFSLSFLSNSQSTTGVTVGIKTGKNFSSGAIAGPGCSAGLPQMAVSVEQIITNEDGEIIKIIEDPYTQCIENVQKWDFGTEQYQNLIKVPLEDALQATSNGSPLEFLGVPGQACSRAIVKSIGDNTWYYVSGRWVWY